MNKETAEYLQIILNGYWDNSIIQSYNYNIPETEIEDVKSFISANRIEGYVWKVFRDIKSTNSIICCSKKAYQENVEEYSRILEEIQYVAKCLEQNSPEYAFVNGSYYIPFVCEPGERVQRDIDIVICKQNYEIMHRVLEENDFFPSIIERGKVRRASRIEIKYALRNNNSIIPYYKKVENDYIRDIWIDIDIYNICKEDFHKIISKKILCSDTEIVCLNEENNIVYTCNMVFLKLKTFRYVKQKQDNVLYILCELNQIIHRRFDSISWDKVKDISKIMGAEEEVFFTVTILLDIFYTSYSIEQIAVLNNLIHQLDIQDFSFVNQIYDRSTKNIYQHECTVKEYLFSINHERLLKMITKM